MRIAGIFFAAFGLAVLLFGAHALAAGLEIRNAENRVLFSREIGPGAGFAIRYIHSVALTPVTDYFIVKNNKIWLDKTVYKDFGAGLPTYPEAGQTMRTENGRIEISGFNRGLGEFAVRVGRIAKHTLLLWPGGKIDEGEPLEIPLATLAPPGSALTFSAAPDRRE